MGVLECQFINPVNSIRSRTGVGCVFTKIRVVEGNLRKEELRGHGKGFMPTMQGRGNSAYGYRSGVGFFLGGLTWRDSEEEEGWRLT